MYMHVFVQVKSTLLMNVATAAHPLELHVKIDALILKLWYKAEGKVHVEIHLNTSLVGIVPYPLDTLL